MNKITHHDIPKDYRFKNLIGEKFGRLTIIRFLGKDSNKHFIWLCRCDCGVEKTIIGQLLRNGKTKSCGCLRSELSAIKSTTHGQSKTNEYKAWKKMIGRCFCKTDKHYKDYGGRGISVCDRWRDSYMNFISDMGQKPSPKHSVGRINNEGDYCPENCRWENQFQQMSNTRHNRFIEYDGKRQPLS